MCPNASSNFRSILTTAYDIEMNSTLTELERGPFGLESGRGVETAPEVDVKSWLKGQMSQRAAQN